MEFQDFQDVITKHPVEGRVVGQWVIPPKEYSGFFMPKGQTLRLVDLEGQQVPDVVCFQAHNLTDELNLANSQLANKHQELRKGDTLYSVLFTPLMKITGYSNELCFTYGSMCSEELNRLRYGVANTRNCRDNLTRALSPWGIAGPEIPNAFVPFMRVEVEEDGTMEIKEPTSVAGDFYDLRAETDLVVGISNCPQERNPCNAFNPTATGVILYEDG
jgi:uncharacterized protein YcgI (DUF1989 family)